MINQFWTNPQEFKNDSLFEDLQNYFIDGCKERNDAYKLFKIRPSQSLLDSLQSEKFGLVWFLRNYSCTSQLSSNDREFFFQLIQTSPLETCINEVLDLVLKGSIDFFNSKCFFELFFTKLLIADYSWIEEDSQEEKILKGNELIFKERANFYMNLTSDQLENYHSLPFYPSINPKNHLFLFFLAVSRLQLQSFFPSFNFILPSIHQKLPIEKSTTNSQTRKVLLSGLEYETFNYQLFSQSHISCLEDSHWKWMKQIFLSLSPIDSLKT